jgi:hypothetical protein
VIEQYDFRRYVIFLVSEIPVIDFSQVLEGSPETLRKSIDETKALIKYEGAMPSSVQALTTKEGPYTHPEIIAILQTSEWSLNPR